MPIYEDLLRKTKALERRVANLETQETPSRRNNYTATAVPGAGDDTDDGYRVGSEWLNTSTGKWYKCRAATAGSAVWDALN